MNYRMVMVKTVSLIFLLVIFPNDIFSAQLISQWQPSGTLTLPSYSYAFLSTTPTGDLLVTTFNTRGIGQASLSLPALLIKNPTSSNPEVVELCNVSFVPQSGYAGITCDQNGFFYLSGDTRSPNTSFLRKFKPDGSPDITFGVNGVVYPGKRCLGLDIIGNYLLLAVDWGEIRIYDNNTGEELSKIPSSEPHYVRDIAIDPTSMKIYGVAAGSVVVWSGGNPWEPEKYQFDILTPQSGNIRSGEGISMDPIQRCAMITPVPGNILHTVFGMNDISKIDIPQASSSGHLVDTALSFDGKMLFVTDIVNKSVHIMRRRIGTPVPESLPIASNISPGSKRPYSSSTVPDIQAKPVTWHKSYTRIVESARRQNKPMIIYFRRNGVKKCEEVEENILLTNRFNYLAQNYICVFEDTEYSTLLAYKMGVFRVPHIIIPDARGEVMQTFTYSIDADNLYSTLMRLN